MKEIYAIKRNGKLLGKVINYDAFLGAVIIEPSNNELLKKAYFTSEVRLVSKEEYLKEQETRQKNMGELKMEAITGFTINHKNYFDPSTIKDVRFNNPATIIFWKDGTKTVVKCQEGDTFNPELGFLAAVLKKLCGNNGNYNNVVRKWVYPND